MSIPNENIIFLIKKVKPLLDACKIPYWLGRGVVGDLLVNGELKCKHSDVDFHVLIKDKKILEEKLISEFEKEGGYTIENKEHKLAFYKPVKDHEYYVEFPYIFDDTINSSQVYHISCRERKYCPKECFDLEKVENIKINEIEIRIPAFTEKYLNSIHGDNWRSKYLNCKK